MIQFYPSIHLSKWMLPVKSSMLLCLLRYNIAGARNWRVTFFLYSQDIERSRSGASLYILKVQIKWCTPSPSKDAIASLNTAIHWEPDIQLHQLMWEIPNSNYHQKNFWLLQPHVLYLYYPHVPVLDTLTCCSVLFPLWQQLLTC